MLTGFPSTSYLAAKDRDVGSGTYFIWSSTGSPTPGPTNRMGPIQNQAAWEADWCTYMCAAWLMRVAGQHMQQLFHLQLSFVHMRVHAGTPCTVRSPSPSWATNPQWLGTTDLADFCLYCYMLFEINNQIPLKYLSKSNLRRALQSAILWKLTEVKLLFPSKW